jgi:hypothetical protein
MREVLCAQWVADVGDVAQLRDVVTADLRPAESPNVASATATSEAQARRPRDTRTGAKPS